MYHVFTLQYHKFLFISFQISTTRLFLQSFMKIQFFWGGVGKFNRLGVCQSITIFQLSLEALDFHQEQFTAGYLERYGDKCFISYCKLKTWHIFKIQQLNYMAEP